jgi:hypothetical protein
MSEWQPIETAPKDGTRIIGRLSYANPRRNWKLSYTTRKTFWGKTSHVPIYGWNHGRDPEDMGLWSPTQWKPIKDSNDHP